MLILFLGATLAMLVTLLSVEFAATPRDSVIYALTHGARSIAAAIALVAVSSFGLVVAVYLFIWVARSLL